MKPEEVLVFCIVLNLSQETKILLQFLKLFSEFISVIKNTVAISTFFYTDGSIETVSCG